MVNVKNCHVEISKKQRSYTEKASETKAGSSTSNLMRNSPKVSQEAMEMFFMVKIVEGAKFGR